MRKGLLNLIGIRTISQKIIAGFIVIYIFFIANGILTWNTLTRSDEIIVEIKEVVNPSIDLLEEFVVKVSESKGYAISWVHTKGGSADRDKESLKILHDNYPEFQDRIEALKGKWNNNKLVRQINDIFIEFRALIVEQKKIRQNLVNKDDYNSPIKQKMEDLLDQEIIPTANKILEQLDKIIEQKKKERLLVQKKLLEESNKQRRTTAVLGAVLVVLGIVVNFWTRRQIVRPLRYIRDVFERIGQGELPEDRHYRFNNDEIGEMAESADELINALRDTSAFAEQIGQGAYDTDYKPLSENDVLGNALMSMRDNLAKSTEEEKTRTWSTEGQVKFSEILKENNKNIKELADKVISELVKYIGANQGGLFIIEGEESNNNGYENGAKEEEYMTLVSCYAWDKKKYLEQKVYKGDGLAGQAWLERATNVLNEVPQGYVQITSGLGEATPTCVLIVPLLLNEKVYGVVEIASFEEFKSYQVDFVEKVAESIASTIANVKIAERTQQLLAESTSMTEQMRNQEEEMRLNMEQLQSAQELMEISRKEAQEREELINVTSIVLETDKKFLIQSANELAEAKLKYDINDFIGMSLDYIFESDDVVEEVKEQISRGFKWINFIYLKNKDNQRIFVKASATAIRNQRGRITKYLFLFDDITEASS